MREQEPEKRSRNFKEVSLGYNLSEAQTEAERCLQCKNRPCVKGCPVGVPIPDILALIQSGHVGQAATLLKHSNALPAVCGRVCPQETQCEKFCVRGIKGEPVAIGRLERFVADEGLNAPVSLSDVKPNGIKVAVVGGGPAGLTCAGELARAGFQVTLFEALHKAGGVLMYGIPEFRLPKAIVQKEIDTLKELGVDIVTNCVIGRSITVDELLHEGFRAVFIGSGAGLPSFMGIPGENLNGVYSANEFLTRINLMGAYRPDAITPIKPVKQVVVVGGGNVAMDAARCAKRLGAHVTIVYRRSEAELPARAEEIEHAREEGIVFKMLTNPTEVLGNEGYNVIGVRCIDMELGEPDESGRRSPVEKGTPSYAIACDCVVMAIGSSPNPLIRMTTPDLETNRRGCIVIKDEETGETSKEGVFAGGDTVTGAATVILAMGAGKKAAAAIIKKLTQ